MSCHAFTMKSFMFPAAWARLPNTPSTTCRAPLTMSRNRSLWSQAYLSPIASPAIANPTRTMGLASITTFRRPCAIAHALAANAIFTIVGANGMSSGTSVCTTGTSACANPEASLAT